MFWNYNLNAYRWYIKIDYEFFRYCHECINKVTGERNCIVCGKKQSSSGRLMQCELCPRAFHQDCMNPPMTKVIIVYYIQYYL